MKRSIVVKVDVEALHQWADCDLPQVEYLKYLHRHTFQVLCEVEVTHGNRDIEFIDFKHKVQNYIQQKYYSTVYGCCNFGTMSCEHIAEELLTQFSLRKCSVSEDGEFWGIVEI